MEDKNKIGKVANSFPNQNEVKGEEFSRPVFLFLFQGRLQDKWARNAGVVAKIRRLGRWRGLKNVRVDTFIPEKAGRTIPVLAYADDLAEDSTKSTSQGGAFVRWKK
jgi:hypothetical protein